MPRIGVKDLHVHKITEETDTEVTYEESKRIANLIEVGITPQVNNATLYADDQLAESVSVLSRYDITIGVSDISPEDQGMLLGQEVDSGGKVYASSRLNPPAFAISFRAERSDGSYEYRQMFKVKFAPTDETYNTKGETIDFQTESITGVSMPLKHNGNFNTRVIGTEENKTVTDAWFDEVYTNAVTEPEGK